MIFVLLYYDVFASFLCQKKSYFLELISTANHISMYQNPFRLSKQYVSLKHILHQHSHYDLLKQLKLQSKDISLGSFQCLLYRFACAYFLYLISSQFQRFEYKDDPLYYLKYQIEKVSRKEKKHLKVIPCKIVKSPSHRRCPSPSFSPSFFLLVRGNIVIHSWRMQCSIF